MWVKVTVRWADLEGNPGSNPALFQSIECVGLFRVMALQTSSSSSERNESGASAGASTMEQMVPEITLHILSYLDCKSLCRLSMTDSFMRRAANDDRPWKALYHKDFTTEQDAISPPNGWKAYYAATKAVIAVNEDYYKVFRAKSLRGMSCLWLKADYVKCIHAGGGVFSGYEEVLQSWEIAFHWNQRYEFQLRDVRVRVFGGVAWVTLKEYLNAAVEPLLATNIYEFHNEQWFMVHHHSSPILDPGAVDPAMFA